MIKLFFNFLNYLFSLNTIEVTNFAKEGGDFFMLNTFIKLTNNNKKSFNKLKFIFMIFLLLGMNGWVFEQETLSGSKNNFTTIQIPSLSSPLGELEEENPDTDVSLIQNENSNEYTHISHIEDELSSPSVESKIMAPDSQTKDALWYYDNFTPEQRLNVRKAIDYAIPRDLIIENSYQLIGIKKIDYPYKDLSFIL